MVWPTGVRGRKDGGLNEKNIIRARSNQPVILAAHLKEKTSTSKYPC